MPKPSKESGIIQSLSNMFFFTKMQTSNGGGGVMAQRLLLQYVPGDTYFFDVLSRKQFSLKKITPKNNSKKISKRVWSFLNNYFG